MDKDFTLKDVFDSLKPEQKKAISALVGIAMVTPFIAAIGAKPGIHEYTKYRTVYKPQKNIDCDIRSKRSEARQQYATVIFLGWHKLVWIQ